MAACSLFVEDVVYANKKGKGYSFGLVLENSEMLTSSDEDEPELNEDRVKKGFVRIAWYPTGRESVVAENKVKLADRSLMPGDVVRRFISGQQTQSGFIVDMDVRCHLHIKRTNKYIYNVNSKDLEPLQKFESGQDVVLDMWLGKVVYVNTFVNLLFSDGARCHADESDIADFDDISEKKERRGEFGAGLFYEGQELRGPFDHLASVEWLHSTPRFSAKTAKKKGHLDVNVTVEKVVTGSVDVQWVFKRFEDPDMEVTTPDTVVQGEQLKKLKVLDWFDYCSVVIADRKMYRIKNDDYLTTVEPSQVFDPACLIDRDYGVPALASCNTIPSQPTLNQASNLEAGAIKEHDIEVCDDDSDDEEEKTGDSVAKASGGGVSNKKKKRGGYKATGTKFKPAKQSQRGAASSKKKNSTKERMVAADSLVEVEVEFTNSWATVMWQDGSVECDIPSSELFPVHHLDELEFFPGDFVLPQVDIEFEPDYGVVVRCDHTERTCIIDWFKAFDGIKEKEPKVLQKNAEVSVYDIKDHPVFKFRPGQTVVLITAVEPNNLHKTSLQSVGQILKFDPHGQLVIKWSDGTIGLCHPQEVYMVSEEDEDDDSDDDSWDGDSNSESSSDTWETESESEIIGEEIENKDEKASTDAINEQKQELNSLLSRAQSALVRLQTLLNSFDVSISAPECFHDIIRIYRSCHDVDKILRSSFFSDPELQNLITQAKREVKRDKANKISQHLNQLLESWGKPSSDPTSEPMTIRIGTFSGKTLHVSVNVKNKNDDSGLTVEENEKDKSGEASGGVCDMRTDDSGVESSSGNASDEMRNCRALRKEYSEPLISNMHKEEVASTQYRSPSDPALQTGVVETSRQGNGNVNMVGENCVGKATKRTKSDSLDYVEHDPKKSKEETPYVNHTAQELCFKICENLQRLLLKIHEEVDKRTSRLMSNEEKKAICSDTSSVNVKEEGAVFYVNNESFNADTSTSGLQNEEESEKSEEVLKESVSTDGMQADISLTGAAVEVEAEKDDLSLSDDDTSIQDEPSKGFCLNEEVGTFHKFSSQQYQPSNPRAFNVAVRKELHLLKSSLPDGIFVQGFENRLDLYSVMILGPAGTPYEDAVFLFDFMLPKDYPSSPPLCHYHSFCSERLNPNLYEDGKVCVSLLGTWSGKGSEMWTSKSNMLQVFLSIQGLILVREPYYNEAGYERQRGTQVGEENSRMYNEMAVLKTVQSLTKMCHKLPTAFENDIRTHLLKSGSRIIKRLQKWVEMAQSVKNTEESSVDIEFPKSSPANGANGVVSNASMESQVTDKLHHLQMNGKISPEIKSVAKESSAPTSPSLADVTDNCDKDVDGSGEQVNPAPSICQGPDFPLLPISRGFCLALRKALESFDNALKVLESTT